VVTVRPDPLNGQTKQGNPPHLTCVSNKVYLDAIVLASDIGFALRVYRASRSAEPADDILPGTIIRLHHYQGHHTQLIAYDVVLGAPLKALLLCLNTKILASDVKHKTTIHEPREDRCQYRGR
jgi:hypothetical protein